MAREATPLVIADLSAFARSLRRALVEAPPATPPGHVEMLNLIARAAGYRNVQALKAAPRPAAPGTASVAEAALPNPAPTAAPSATPSAGPGMPLTPLAHKTLQHFDAQWRLQRWPVKFSVQKLAMWALWTLFDGKRVYTEREVNAILRTANAFGDHVTLRRELINHRLMTRTSDCREYRKLPARPDDETRALLQAWRARRPQASPAGVLQAEAAAMAG